VFKRLKVHNLQQALGNSKGLELLNVKHGLGIFLFGFLFFYQTPEYLYLIADVEIPRLPVLLIILTIFLLSAFVSFRTIEKSKADFISKSETRPNKAWIYFIIRFVFLFCYEFFFRGILLFSFLAISSPVQAVTYMVLLYVLIHIFDSKKEIIGAVPFGILLAVFTILTNSIWYAFLIHIALSSTYEIPMFYYQTLSKKTNIS
jgi:membrane protease YdiL (CAAX protease family)